MSTPAFRAPPLEYPSPWGQWSGEVAEAGEWAARTLARVLITPLTLPVRLLSRMHWGSGEALVSTVVLGMPAIALASWATRVVWPTWEQALLDLRHLAVVLGVTYLALTITRVQHGSGRSCCAGGRHLVPSPNGTKTWRWIVSVHEAGHLVVGSKLGRRTGKAKIAGGGGYTIVHPQHHDIVGEIAIDMAGGIAAGTQEGCSGDQAHAQSRLQRYVAPKRHGAVMAAGTRKAHSMVNAHRGEILRKARQIYDRGWTR